MTRYSLFWVWVESRQSRGIPKLTLEQVVVTDVVKYRLDHGGSRRVKRLEIVDPALLPEE